VFTFTGYKGQKFEADYGWDVADENGRGGKLIEVYTTLDDPEQIIEVEPKLDTSLKEQLTIELKEREISFVYPPEV
jgi:hypothetical protein